MEELKLLYHAYLGKLPEEILPLPPTASARKYFRLKSGSDSLIGSYSPDIRETRAFVAFTKHFRSKGIHVPEVYIVSEDQLFYLQQDLGEVALFDRMANSGFNFSNDPELEDLYRKALKELVRVQFDGHQELDYTLSVPRAQFDKQSILWDLNHFKYYFLKLSGIPLDEDLLEKDFQALALFLSEKPMNNFMFRDFQSRNIMIQDGEVYLIDYQGGRKGPPHYDLASMLFEGKTHLSEEMRLKLLDEYISYAAHYAEINRAEFNSEFYWWSLIRILQVLGAYGLRGTIEKIPVFLQSIPQGLKNLEFILNRVEGGPSFSELNRCLLALVKSADRYPKEPLLWEGLTISLSSFSYKKFYPDDLSGNGGGFVYDCRFIANPGRFEKYRRLTGFDPEVESFFMEKGDMDDFLRDVMKQLTKVVEVYRSRNFKHLSVSFGCTGGQHRSVYATRKTAEFLRQLDKVRVIERHREIPGKN